MRSVSAKVVGKIKTHFSEHDRFFFPKILPFMRQRGKNIVEMDRPQMTKAHAHCMLDAKGHEKTLRIYYTHCFSAATISTRTCLYVTLYVHCLHFSFFHTSLCVSGVLNLFSLWFTSTKIQVFLKINMLHYFIQVNKSYDLNLFLFFLRSKSTFVFYTVSTKIWP